MTTELLHIILPLIAAIITAPIASWLTSKLQRQKYEENIRQLRAEIDKIKSEVTSNELENVRKACNMLMEQIVEPLEKELTKIRNVLNRFRKAFEDIAKCAHTDSCPVRLKLLELEKDPDCSTDK